MDIIIWYSCNLAAKLCCEMAIESFGHTFLSFSSLAQKELITNQSHRKGTYMQQNPVAVGTLQVTISPMSNY